MTTEPGEIRPKWLTVAQLKRVLAELPDDYELICNEFQNIAVYKPDGDGGVLYVGFIDFLFDGSFET